MEAIFGGPWRGDANNVDEHIESEDEELDRDHERAETTEYPIQDFATRSKVQKRSCVK